MRRQAAAQQKDAIQKSVAHQDVLKHIPFADRFTTIVTTKTLVGEDQGLKGVDTHHEITQQPRRAEEKDGAAKKAHVVKNAVAGSANRSAVNHITVATGNTPHGGGNGSEPARQGTRASGSKNVPLLGGHKMRREDALPPPSTLSGNSSSSSAGSSKHSSQLHLTQRGDKLSQHREDTFDLVKSEPAHSDADGTQARRRGSVKSSSSSSGDSLFMEQSDSYRAARNTIGRQQVRKLIRDEAEVNDHESVKNFRSTQNTMT